MFKGAEMTSALTLYRSSIGKKAVMALTGFIMIGFVVFHMYGNLKLYQGPELFNEYAAGLREIGAPIFAHGHLLWIARVVLLASVVLHIAAATQLTLMSRESTGAYRAGARRYGRQHYNKATYAARTMRWGGVLVALFIIYHLLHFTFGLVGYAPGQFQPEQNGVFHVYDNLVHGFSVWYISLFYIAAMVALALHLYHGTWSMFQTLGLNSGAYNSLWRGLAVAIAAVVFIGNVSFPIAVLSGLVR
jgi:succinate dehydrogenase / fumarate reductase cytochrome b subunit